MEVTNKYDITISYGIVSFIDSPPIHAFDDNISPMQFSINIQYIALNDICYFSPSLSIQTVMDNTLFSSSPIKYNFLPFALSYSSFECL